MRHTERHKTHRIGWLRAAVLGANDGIVSTASLVLGVAAAGASSQSILVAGVAGLVAGAMSMAAGEYVSVSSQADTERADMDRERKELAAAPEHEHAELAAMFSVGAVLPLLIVLLVPVSALMWAVSASSLVFLALLGSLAARAGGSSVMTAAVRVTFWGALAMGLTAGVGALFGVAA